MQNVYLQATFAKYWFCWSVMVSEMLLFLRYQCIIFLWFHKNFCITFHINSAIRKQWNLPVEFSPVQLWFRMRLLRTAAFGWFPSFGFRGKNKSLPLFFTFSAWGPPPSGSQRRIWWTNKMGGQSLNSIFNPPRAQRPLEWNLNMSLNRAEQKKRSCLTDIFNFEAAALPWKTISVRSKASVSVTDVILYSCPLL